MAVITVVDTSIRTSVVPCNCSPWWRGAGIVIPTANCIAAYTPVGAIDKANSLINNANPGTYDAVEVGTVVFVRETGWTFNGSNNGMYCGVLAWDDVSSSLFVRFSNSGATNGVIMAGYTTDTDDESWYLNSLNGSSQAVFNNYKNQVWGSAGSQAGVIGFAGRNCFFNTNLVATMASPETPHQSTISFGYNIHGTDKWWAGNVLAAAMYDIELTNAQATALVVAMQALPDYADGDKTPAEA